MIMNRLKQEIKELFNNTLHTSLILFKIMIPVSIIVKIFEQFQFIEVFGNWLSPVMQILGLPGETGLVWATAMITNIYGGIIVFISLSSTYTFSIAEVTILCSMILVAHSLPVEVTIARKAGIRMWFTLLLRIFSAFLFGFLLHHFFSFFHLLSSPSVMLWQPAAVDASLTAWLLNQLRNYIMIFAIIFSLLTLMRILKQIGIIDKFNTLAEPALEFFGMSKHAAPLTIIGLTLGISYGGGIIIKETQSGKLSKKDAFLSVSMMGLSHSLIEDTLLMMTIGASLLGILIGRILFTFVGMLIIIFIINRISKQVFLRYFATT